MSNKQLTCYRCNEPVEDNACGCKDGCTIIHGDNLGVIPVLRADITVSSPPYNMIAKSTPSGLFKEHSRKKNAGYISHADDMPRDSYEKWVVKVFGKCVESCEGTVWVNHKTKFTNKVGKLPARLYPWPVFCEIIWDCCGSLTLNARRFAPSHEHILGFGAPHYWDRQNDTLLTVWRIPPERNIPGHPCPFPVQIPRRLIESSCPKNGVVLDPFMGSGSTLVAAKETGRRAIGIEIEEKYCEIAANRLKQEVMF